MIAACSTDTTNPFPDVNSFCTALASAECDGASVCANKTDACKSARSAHCNGLATGAAATSIDPFSVAAGSARTYTSGNVQGCLDATKTLYGQHPIKPSDFTSQQTACNKVFQGAGKQNDPCKETSDCSGSYICDKGVCSTQVNKMLNDPCADPGDTCDPTTSYCATTTNNRCTALVSNGAACSATVLCQPNLACANALCVAKKQQGDTCVLNADCDPSAPFCDPNAMNKCDPGLTLAPGTAVCKNYGG
jgi:hypothetical protein